MWLSDEWKDYEVIDTSSGEKLERWGKYILVRPDPQVIWSTPKNHPLWRKYDAKYSRSNTGGGKWSNLRLPEQWQVHYKELTFNVKPMNFKHTGVFPEQAANWDFAMEKIRTAGRPISVLNLFAYTGTATCYAADGGAKFTTTVDLSRPSLDWARRNMARNGFTGPEHEFVQADVIQWVSEQRHTRNRWDLVFCDVPTFSNSQRMKKSSWDVQRDHSELIIGVSRLLTRNGCAIFSCNLRGFKPDVEALQKAGVVIEDITASTIPEDFKRNAKIHHAYIVRRG